MKPIILMGILTSFLSIFGCGNKNNLPLITKQIEISHLNDELKLLQENKTEFNFIGITSNGIDCIYFVKDKNNFQIEFEAITENQIPFIEKLKVFASQNKYEFQITTYGTKPQYNSSEAPVIRMLTNSNLEKTTEIGQKIQKEIFKNHTETKYDVVP